MKRKLFLYFFIFIIIVISYSKELKGIGYGKNEIEAKNFALADLSSFIEIEVQSNLDSTIAEISKNNEKISYEYSSHIIKTKSELPILGAEYNIKKIKNYFFCEAIIKTENTIKIYEDRLNTIKNTINKNLNLLNQKKDNNSKIEILKTIFKDLNQFKKLKIVTLFLGSSYNAEEILCFTTIEK
ncbi:MAG TPA: hypothetical protein PLE45_09605 [Spirochaetota bacterium]|nr:hypothetical protein [Spirochaetota bacterium]HOL56565.1 hypothetical protein [Spirochaetota bacterium]HPP04902.1 hypothetical protein [Spirochaetota bacterium]